MDKIKIRGGRPLNGVVQISGAKNAALPEMFACLLTADECELRNLPGLRDIHSAAKVLRALGAECDIQNQSARVRAADIQTFTAPYPLVKTMRASILALGPLLARFGQARVSLPGGCAIGARPVDMHLDGLRKMGADIHIEDGDIVARAGRLCGARIVLPKPTVTGSENLMMAAALAEGDTRIENAAREPEIADLAAFLNKMGAKISGAEKGDLRITGVSSLRGAAHAVPPDRIESATYLCAAAACGGEITLRDSGHAMLHDLLQKLSAAGGEWKTDGDSLTMTMRGRPKAVDADTAPYPGFATDMQAQWMAVCAVAEGTAAITENIFENRFMHAAELSRLGAKIELHRNAAIVRGVKKLKGAPLMATDLRASASLAVAALAAHGESVIDRVYHLERGYETMPEKLRALGADVERVSGGD